MSIGIAIAVPDGIALAADTQTTWSNIILRAKDKKTGNEFDLAEPIAVPVGWSQCARKLFSVVLGGKTYAIITACEANLNQTVADAVDYTRFLVAFTCDFQRFAIMVPNCGRPISSATLTPESFEEKVVA